jgi:hypothetical protein
VGPTPIIASGIEQKFLWRMSDRAPQKKAILWRTKFGAPQKYVFLWRMFMVRHRIAKWCATEIPDLNKKVVEPLLPPPTPFSFL